MEDIAVKSYAGQTGYRGWIEPTNRSWILFIRDDGTPEFYPERNSLTGAVIDRRKEG